MTQMVATRRVKYPHGHSGREYAPGEVFTALSERDAKKLHIHGVAKYAPEAPANKTDLPKEVMQTKEVAEEPAPLSQTYLRRDMQAFPIGEETPSPSSRRGRPPRKQTSESSEDE